MQKGCRVESLLTEGSSVTVDEKRMLMPDIYIMAYSYLICDSSFG
jgi:hypothetical protein